MLLPSLLPSEIRRNFADLGKTSGFEQRSILVLLPSLLPSEIRGNFADLKTIMLEIEKRLSPPAGKEVLGRVLFARGISAKGILVTAVAASAPSRHRYSVPMFSVF